MRTLIACALALSCWTKAAGEAINPDAEIFEIRYQPMGISAGVYALDLVSLEDNITITGLRINRGNCRPTVAPHLPSRVRFGEAFRVFAFYNGGCVPIELDVWTDKGQFRFTSWVR